MLAAGFDFVVALTYIFTKVASLCVEDGYCEAPLIHDSEPPTLYHTSFSVHAHV